MRRPVSTPCRKSDMYVKWIISDPYPSEKVVCQLFRANQSPLLNFWRVSNRRFLPKTNTNIGKIISFHVRSGEINRSSSYHPQVRQWDCRLHLLTDPYIPHPIQLTYPKTYTAVLSFRASPSGPWLTPKRPPFDTCLYTTGGAAERCFFLPAADDRQG